MSEQANKRREDLPLSAPNADGNVWPKQVCPAFISRNDTPAGIFSAGIAAMRSFT